MAAKNYTKVDKDVAFLFEMGTIRYVTRMWRRFNSPGFANLAEHHFHVFWVAMVLASQDKNVDTGKVAKMVLVHDIAESRTNDVDYVSREYVARNELLGISDMLEGASVEEEFMALWHEYEERTSLEAKIVKDADTLNCDFELAEQKASGNTIGEVLGKMRKKAVRPRLYTETAKILFDHLQTANIHDWHDKGRNRATNGDWQNKK